MADDFSELDDLADDLDDVALVTDTNLLAAIGRSAQKLKNDWRARATVARGYPKSYARSISYDLHGYTGFGGGEIYADVGPVLHATPGASAGFLEEAGGGVDGPPLQAARNAAEAIQEDYVVGIGRAIEDSVKRLGG